MNALKVLLNGLSRALFWFAFAAFMLAAIPHTAYFFRAWEPVVGPADSQGSLFYWGVAYAIAISVDGMVIYLTRALTVLGKQGGKRFAKAVAWLGIGLLSLLSWFVNWQYAVEFRGSMLDRVLSLPIGPWRIADIDPILASMFQALIIFYSFISDKVHEPPGRHEEEALDALRQRAAEADERARLAASIAVAHQQQRAERARSLLRLGKSVLGELHHAPDDEDMLQQVVQFFQELPHLLEEQHAEEAETLLRGQFKLHKREQARLWRMRAMALLTQQVSMSGGNNSSKTLGVTEDTEHPGQLQNDYGEGGAGRQKAQHNATPMGIHLEEKTEHVSEDHTLFKTAPGGTHHAEGLRGEMPQQNQAHAVSSTASADASGGRRTLTIQEVAVATGYSEKYVRDLRHKGVLKTAPRNKHLILRSSVNMLLQVRQNQGQKPRYSPALVEAGEEPFQGRKEQAHAADGQRVETLLTDHQGKQGANNHA